MNLRYGLDDRLIANLDPADAHPLMKSARRDPALMPGERFLFAAWADDLRRTGGNNTSPRVRP